MAELLQAPLAQQFEQLPAGWRDHAGPFLQDARFEHLCAFVDQRLRGGAAVFPPRPFAALQAAVPRSVRVVIVGQDPYHGAGQANGLAFAVNEGVPAPPSLRNIQREVTRDCGCDRPPPASLQHWARQGVLLLNAVLTVEQGQPGSHARHGWEEFTSTVIASLASQASPRVFMLWGASAQAHRPLIEQGGGRHHLILAANHPSPLSARRGPTPFLGCGHFSQANRFLREHHQREIDWCA